MVKAIFTGILLVLSIPLVPAPINVNLRANLEPTPKLSTAGTNVITLEGTFESIWQSFVLTFHYSRMERATSTSRAYSRSRKSCWSQFP